MQKLYLASGSPRRQELLQQMGLTFSLLKPDVPEQRNANESPEQYSQRNALAKARAGFAMLSGTEQKQALVLGADTEVVLDDEVFGKPEHAEHAKAMLRKLSARLHQTMSSVAIVSQSRLEVALQISNVQFKALSEAEIETYVASGEPMGRAGAYAIQGLAAKFISNLTGSYSGVMGLPVYETAQLLQKFGIQ